MNKNIPDNSRRKFIHDLGLAGLGIPFLSSCSFLDNKQNTKKLGIALVGLGNYATGQLAPALQRSQYCYLAGIVTGSPAKAENWKSRYNIPEKNIYNYENFDSIKDNPAIDIVYVVLPNFLHAAYSIRAAKAGKHVICEKPMAMNAAECDQMMAACKEAGKMLSIGYRLHFEPYNLEMARLGQQKIYGTIKKMSAGFGFSAGDPTQWRLKKDLSGGGPMVDVGIYCMQGFCYTTGMLPIAVTAQEGKKMDKEKFKEVEASLSFQFEMPNGLICEGKASYEEGMNYLKAEADKGIFELTSAFIYSGQAGYTPNGPMNFPKVNQQANQIDAFALSIKNNTASIVPGEMGKRDVQYIHAVYEAMRTGKRIEI